MGAVFQYSASNARADGNRRAAIVYVAARRATSMTQEFTDYRYHTTTVKEKRAMKRKARKKKQWDWRLPGGVKRAQEVETKQEKGIEKC